MVSPDTYEYNVDMLLFGNVLTFESISRSVKKPTNFENDNVLFRFERERMTIKSTPFSHNVRQANQCRKAAGRESPSDKILKNCSDIHECCRCSSVWVRQDATSECHSFVYYPKSG